MTQPTREEIKQKAKELANKAYWRTKCPPGVNKTMYEISDPNVEEILQEAMLWAITSLEKQLEEANSPAIVAEFEKEFPQYSDDWTCYNCGCSKNEVEKYQRDHPNANVMGPALRVY